VRHGGAGPPLLLLHGHPRRHATWHRVAPLLAAERTIACPDLRESGESWKPPTTDEEDLYGEPVAIWREWAEDVGEARIDCGA
jgi:haloacetate dehalogenase